MIKNPAESCEHEELTKEPITDEMLRSLGLIEVTSDLKSKSLEIITGWNQPVGVFARDNNGQLATLEIRIAPRQTKHVPPDTRAYAPAIRAEHDQYARP